MRYMDYDKFKKEYEAFEEWTKAVYWNVPKLDNNDDKVKVLAVDNDGNFYNPESQNDLVNSPAHYTRGNQECIDTIEEAIQDAPDPIVGSLQYQVLKYILRMWLKGNPLRDCRKAQWYLARLINKLENDD